MIDSLRSGTGLDVAASLPDTAIIPLLMLQESVSIAEAESAKKIFQVESKLGRPMMIKLTCAIIKLFNDSVNTSEQMTPFQVFEAAQLWVETYRTESLKDLIMCLKRVKTGKYGKIYNRIDIQVLNEFFEKYMDEKAQWREDRAAQYRIQEFSNQTGQLVETMDELQLSDAMKERITVKLRSTPDVKVAASGPMSSYESYLEELRKTLPVASEEELESLQKQAVSRNMIDVVNLVDQELERRKVEVIINPVPAP